MEYLLIIAALIFAVPLTFFVLRSISVLRTHPGDYYDFTPVLEDTKNWTAFFYLGVIAIMALVVLAVFGLPFASLPA